MNYKIIDIIKYLLLRNSPCRTLQKIESENFVLSGDCLEVGNFNFNKKSFFNDFSLKQANIFFCDLKKLKQNNYFSLNLEKKNIIKKFDNIVIFNVLEHVFDVDNAFSELNKLLNLMANYIYPRHFYTDTIKLLKIISDLHLIFTKNYKKRKFKIIYKKSLSTGPFFCSYSIIHNIYHFYFY